MAGLPRPAQYLLRIDDLCPTVHRASWEGLQAIVREFAIQPILAVVPENRDPDLFQSPEDPALWAELRALQSNGAAIGLHGLHHLCASRRESLVPLHRMTEFAGLPLEEQRSRLRAGLEILRGKGLEPQLWVAPRHGFDWKTIAALRAEGIEWLSDGMARVPFERGGVRWIPQQLWRPVSKDAGLWTICLHPGAALMEQLEEIRAFVERHRGQFTSFARVRSEFSGARFDAGELLYEAAAMWRLRLRYARKRWRHA